MEDVQSREIKAEEKDAMMHILASSDTLNCCYVSFSVLFQTKSSLVWKRYTQKLFMIFQTNSSLVWEEKN